MDIQEHRLRKIDDKIRNLNDKLIKSLNPYQQKEFKTLYKLKYINKKNSGNWQHRTGIMEAQENISYSWNSEQNNLLSSINSLLTDMEEAYRKSNDRNIRRKDLIERYRLHYIE